MLFSGVAPIDFKKDEVVEIRGVKMTSTKTQLPYEYFSLPFCQPEAGVTYQQLNLGEVLRGDRIVDTAYDVKMDQRWVKFRQKPVEINQIHMTDPWKLASNQMTLGF